MSLRPPPRKAKPCGAAYLFVNNVHLFAFESETEAPLAELLDQRRQRGAKRLAGAASSSFFQKKFAISGFSVAFPKHLASIYAFCFVLF